MRKDFIFTSELIIISDDEKVERKLFDERKSVESYINDNFNFFNENSRVNSENFKFSLSFVESLGVSNYHLIFEIIENYSKKLGKLDMTCCLKGLFLNKLISTLDLDDKHLNFIISFGKDICGFRKITKISVENSKTHFYTPLNLWGCFTSGNYGVRGSHILTLGESKFKNLTVFGECKPEDLAFMDAYSTYLYSKNKDFDFLNKGYTILTERL